MDRYGAVTSVTFAGTVLDLPLSVRVSRRTETAPAGGDAGPFVASVQIRRAGVEVEVRTRDTAAAEALSPGQSGALTVQVAPTRSGQNARTITLDKAVLTDVEVRYEQAAPALARLCFAGESEDGQRDPLTAGETAP